MNFLVLFIYHTSNKIILYFMADMWLCLKKNHSWLFARKLVFNQVLRFTLPVFENNVINFCLQCIKIDFCIRRELIGLWKWLYINHKWRASLQSKHFKIKIKIYPQILIYLHLKERERVRDCLHGLVLISQSMAFIEITFSRK